VIPDEWRAYFEGKKLLHPFAGFGSIPLEALRLGLSVTAIELLSAAYVFLDTVLELPHKHGERLVKEVEKWVADEIRKDPVIKKLYNEHVEVCICSWEVKCPIATSGRL
jgi:putative DNA methylase